MADKKFSFSVTGMNRYDAPNCKFKKTIFLIKTSNPCPLITKWGGIAGTVIKVEVFKCEKLYH